jgi:hypothetical protein
MRLFKKHEPEELLVEKYFSFLIEQHGFTYSNYCFESEKLRIALEIGHKTPSIFITRAGEPGFARLIFERIIQYFKDPLPDIDFQVHSLEHNIRYMADILRSYAPRIINHIDEWWLPAQVFQYKLLEKNYRDAGQLDDFLTGFKRDHDYLKSKGAIE